MKNRVTQDEIRFEARLWISDVKEHASDLSVEFPAIYPDRPAYPRKAKKFLLNFYYEIFYMALGRKRIAVGLQLATNFPTF